MLFDKMRIESTEIVQRIHQHPFNLELGNGCLAQQTFIYYLQQDALYLKDYAKALAITAGRLQHTQHVQQFLEFAHGAITAERELHKKFVTHLAPVEQNMACFTYTNYLLRLATHASPEESAAGLLPCFWVYLEVGKNLQRDNSIYHPYHDWITLYSSHEFAASVQAAIQIINEIGDDACERTQTKMKAAFMRACDLEHLFWEFAYYDANNVITPALHSTASNSKLWRDDYFQTHTRHPLKF